MLGVGEDIAVAMVVVVAVFVVVAPDVLFPRYRRCS